jgi:hypothetical protein
MFYIDVTIHCNARTKHIDHMMRYNILSYFGNVKMGNVLHRCNNPLQCANETHRAYDALQYPILFWQGEDGYHFSMKMINPVTGSEINKKVSSMNYCRYRQADRENWEIIP